MDKRRIGQLLSKRMATRPYNTISLDEFATPHSVPVFLRAAVLRVVAGSQLLAACFAFATALVSADASDQASCALATATCGVAFYHYKKLLELREQINVRVALEKPGSSAPTNGAKLAWQEMGADAVRYSDWAVTLPPLLIDLHLLVGSHAHLFSVAIGCLLCTVMVGLGAYTRLGTDELAPRPGTRERFDFVNVTGILSFALSSLCLGLVLGNLLLGLETDPSEGWVYVFSLPWILYGVVSMISMIWRNVSVEAHPEGLAVFKDVAFGALDVHSKALFAFFLSLKALGLLDRVI